MILIYVEIVIANLNNKEIRMKENYYSAYWFIGEIIVLILVGLWLTTFGG
jgi:hypothetical protein